MAAAGQHAVIIPSRLDLAQRRVRYYIARRLQRVLLLTHMCVLALISTTPPPPSSPEVRGGWEWQWEVTVDSGGPPTRTRTPLERAQRFWQGNNEPVVDLRPGWDREEKER